MRKLVLTILALIALFAAIRAYPEVVPALNLGIQLHPGLVEIGDASASVGLSFGVIEKTGGQSGPWNLLPLRIVYRSGDRSVAIGLNGLSFLLRGGVSVGTPLRITAPRTGDVISIGGAVTVDARVDGDVWTLGADVELTPRAEVTGDVVALGGKVIAARTSVVHGTVNQAPTLKIPFLGVLGTQFSVQALAFGRHFLGFFLLGIVLFLCSFYLSRHARDTYQLLPVTLKASLLTLVISLAAVPLLAILLVVSVVGIFFLPILAFGLALVALYGFLLLCARLGGLLRRGTAGAGADSLYLFTSGLLGLFLVKAPALVGVSLTLLRSEAAVRIGQILQLVTFILFAAGILYGFGATLACARARSAK